MFDREKVLTPFNCDKAKKGDWGWGADSPRKLELNVDYEKPLMEIINLKKGQELPFVLADKGGYTEYRYFYPAPYELQQEKWVEKVGLKVGDKVKLTRGWCKGEGGYDDFYRIFHEKGKVYTVTEIKPKHIKVDGEGYIALPYFALEKVEEAPTTYRPFANAEEFYPHEHRTLRRWENQFKVMLYNNFGVVIINLMIGEIWGMEACTYKELLDSGFVFNDTGEPAGVKLSSPRLRGCFPYLTKGKQVAVSLPRACGGVSDSKVVPLFFLLSSPRLRGCF